MSIGYEQVTGFYSSKVAMSSEDETWATPQNKFDEWNDEFGFVLDAAALKSSAKCSMWYGPDHEDSSMRDAFERFWHVDSRGGAIWLNPPYGRNIKKWMRRAAWEAENGCTVVCLVPSRTDTAWFHDYCIMHEVRFIRGRLKFGNAVNPAPFPSALVVMRTIG